MPSAQLGSSTITITATNGNTRYDYSVIVKLVVSPPPDFALSEDPTSIHVRPGESGSVTITVTSLNGFNAPVTLTYPLNLKPGITLSISQSPVTPEPGGKITSTFSVKLDNNKKPGAFSPSYNFVITGVGGSPTLLTRTVNVIVIVDPPLPDDFDITANPSSQSVSGGSSGIYTITLTSRNGLTSAVGLTATSDSPLIKPILSVPSVTPPSNGSVDATLTVNADPSAHANNTYPVTVTGILGGVKHSVTVNLVVTPPVPSPDFSIQAPADTLQLQAGGASATVTITLASLHDFNSAVDLGISKNAGLTANLDVDSVTLASGGTQRAILTVAADKNAKAGDYQITITGKNGPLSHTTSVNVRVSQPTSLSAPTNIVVSSTTPHSISITWSSVPGAISYNVFRDTSASGGFTTLVGSTESTAYTDSDLSPLTTYYYKVSATDGTVASAMSNPISGTTLAEAINHNPVASAGPSQKVDEGTLVRLDGSASSDPDGDLLSYSWIQTSGPTVKLSNSNIANPTFSASQPGKVTFLLTVFDEKGGQATSSVDIEIKKNDKGGDKPGETQGTGDENNNNGVAGQGISGEELKVNHVPKAKAKVEHEDKKPVEGTEVTLDGSDSKDPDSDSLSYSWTQLDNSGYQITLSDPHSSNPSFTVPTPLDSDKDFTFVLTVSDGKGGVSNDKVTVSVKSLPPYKTEYPLPPASESPTGITVQPTDHVYKNGEKVKVIGELSQDLISQASGIDQVTIQILDANGKKLAEKDVPFDKSEGKYETSVELPDNVGIGQYEVVSKLKIGVTDAILNLEKLSSLKKLNSVSAFNVGNTEKFPVAVDNKKFDVDIVTNSKVHDFQFKPESKRVSFVVDGDTGTSGVAQVTIPKSMLGGKLQVLFDGEILDAESGKVKLQSSNDTTATLEITYHHSSHTIEILGTEAVPEFSASLSSTVIMAIAIGSIIGMAGIAARRKGTGLGF